MMSYLRHETIGPRGGRSFSGTANVGSGLRRIVRPRGRLYVTVHDQHTIEMLLTRPEFWLTGLLRSVLDRLPLKLDEISMFSIGRSPVDAQVFYDIDSLCEQWSRFLTVLSVTERAYGYQTAILLGKL
jgi:hypothetical protein